MKDLSLNLIVLVGVGLLAGCGSIYCGTTEHIHIYPDQTVRGDNVQMVRISEWIKMIRKSLNQEEPLDGFRWDEEDISRGVKEGEDQ